MHKPCKAKSGPVVVGYGNFSKYEMTEKEPRRTILGPQLVTFQPVFGENNILVLHFDRLKLFVLNPH